MLEFELVLPCYNEGKSLEKLLTRAVAAARSHGFAAGQFGLVVVENGSRDDSAVVLQRLAQGELGAWFKVVQVVENKGYGFGLMAGLRATTAPVVGWTHADEQCDPGDAFVALEVLKKAAEPGKTLVKGERLGRSWKERVVSRVFEGFARWYLGLKVYEVNAQPKVFGRELLEDCTEAPDDFALDLYVLYRAKRAGYRFAVIKVEFGERAHGFSNWAKGMRNRWGTILGMVRYMRGLGSREGRVHVHTL